MRPESLDMKTNPDLPIARPVSEPPPVARPRTGLIVRLALLLVAGGLATVFGLAFWLNPYQPDGTPRTLGTHAQLGLPPCSFVVVTGRPCPSCGMTTSFALLVRGDLAASLRANWAGTVTAVLWAGLLLWSLASGIRGRPLFIPPGYGEVLLTALVGLILALMLTRWGIVLLYG